MISLKNILPVTTVKRDLMRLLTKLGKGESHLIITKDGTASGVLMSAEEYESLMETLEILADKNLLKDLKKSRREMDAGHFYTQKDVFGS